MSIELLFFLQHSSKNTALISPLNCICCRKFRFQSAQPQHTKHTQTVRQSPRTNLIEYDMKYTMLLCSLEKCWPDDVAICLRLSCSTYKHLLWCGISSLIFHVYNIRYKLVLRFFFSFFFISQYIIVFLYIHRVRYVLDDDNREFSPKRVSSTRCVCARWRKSARIQKILLVWYAQKKLWVGAAGKWF